MTNIVRETDSQSVWGSPKARKRPAKKIENIAKNLKFKIVWLPDVCTCCAVIMKRWIRYDYDNEVNAAAVAAACFKDYYVNDVKWKIFSIFFSFILKNKKPQHLIRRIHSGHKTEYLKLLKALNIYYLK